MTNSNQPDRATSVIINGLGYINRIRKVSPNNGQPYLACDVSLMQGTKNSVEYARFSCIIRGSNAKDIVRKYFTTPQGEVKSPEAPVVANMTLGGISAQNFVYRSGKRKGQTGIELKSALLSIKWLKIGNQVVELVLGEQTANGTSPPASPAANTIADDLIADGVPAEVATHLAMISDDLIADGVPVEIATRLAKRHAAGQKRDFVSEMRAEYKQNRCIRLAKSHPQFEERKVFLKDQGFTWNNQTKAWVRKNRADSKPAPQEQSTAPAVPQTQQFEEPFAW